MLINGSFPVECCTSPLCLAHQGRYALPKLGGEMRIIVLRRIAIIIFFSLLSIELKKKGAVMIE